MGPDIVTAWVQALAAGGPYAIAVILGLAFVWRDKQLRHLYDRIIEMTEAQTKAASDLESALQGLKIVIEALANKR